MSLDYRQGPKYHHPAASEDVAAAYRALLTTYRPEDVGIYGCSAGGMLTAMSVAWLQQHGLPRSGAVGLLCARPATPERAFGGDASYTTMPLGEGRVLRPTAAGHPVRMDYFAATDPADPLVAPVSSSEGLAEFPPTLIVTGTRAFELSTRPHKYYDV